MTALQVAFFRNMNLGQTRSHSPTRPVLEDAFTAAGAVSVRSFQTNGTVLFDPQTVSPAALVERVRTTLAQRVGYTDVAAIQPLNAVAALARDIRELLGIIDRSVYTTFFDPDAAIGWATPGALLDALGTTVLASGPGWVVTQVAPGGDPTTAVQAKLGSKATTRGFGTVERLVRAAGLGSGE
ncbi:MAG: DUF1697 domain-containing protein [Micropruina sp.]|uniref:DUF1697 domain-containing protein n=1 Tax=Micropruina sp. TaxID=2737536 RepID=UPI0039E705ED